MRRVLSPSAAARARRRGSCRAIRRSRQRQSGDAGGKRRPDAAWRAAVAVLAHRSGSRVAGSACAAWTVGHRVGRGRVGGSGHVRRRWCAGGDGDQPRFDAGVGGQVRQARSAERKVSDQASSARRPARLSAPADPQHGEFAAWPPRPRTVAPSHHVDAGAVVDVRLRHPDGGTIDSRMWVMSASARALSMPALCSGPSPSSCPAARVEVFGANVLCPNRRASAEGQLESLFWPAC